MTEVRIRAAALSVSYQARSGLQGGQSGRVALREISFSAGTGERIALIGANGAGKSTLFLTLMGILPFGGGELEVCGLPVKKENLRELRRRAALVFQNPEDQLFMPTVAEDVAFGPRNYGLDEPAISARSGKILEALGITPLGPRFSHHLSGGEQRLAALAGVLIMEPDLLLLDEPSSFLDPRARRNLLRILETLPQTLLIATHDLDLARALCRRAILLKDGAIFADGPAADILDNAPLLDAGGL